MKKQSLLSIVIPLVLLVIGGFLFVLVTTKQQEIRTRAGVDMVDLTLSATPNPVAIGSTVTVNVLINTKTTYKVSAVELAMTYDSGAFDPVSIATGTFLPTVLTTGSIQSGTATITLGSGTEPKTGTGTLATLKLKRKSTSSGIVKVDTKTKVAGLNASNVPVTTSILGTAGSVTITSPSSGSPTPSSKITNTPTATSKITPTNIPSSSPTPSPLAISSPTPFSSPTPVPTDDLGGFGGLITPEPEDVQENTPTPLSLALGTTPTVIPGFEMTDEFPEMTAPLEEITPETTFPENFEVSSGPPTKPKKNIPLIVFSLFCIGVLGGALAFFLHKKFGYNLPFFKKHPDQTTPPQIPLDQTQEVNPPITDQSQPPPPTEK
jgi:hypothetical protein